MGPIRNLENINDTAISLGFPHTEAAGIVSWMGCEYGNSDRVDYPMKLSDVFVKKACDSPLFFA